MEIVEYSQSLNLDYPIKKFILDIILVELKQGRKYARPDLDDLSIYKKSGGNMWILIHDRRIFGTIAIRVEDSKAILKRFYVAKTIRRRGWGNILFEVAYNYCLGTDFGYITLNNDTERMVDAYKFYLKKGFKETLRRKDGYVEMRLNMREQQRNH